MYGRLSPPGGKWGVSPLWAGALTALVAVYAIAFMDGADLGTLLGAWGPC